MKIGDKVRFLNEVGGGVVTGFQGRDIVLVEDADGFDIPICMNECVLVEESKATIDVLEKHKSQESIVKQLEMNRQESVPQEEKSTTFVAERRGGDVLNFYLCFVPVEVKTLSTTDFDIYVVNDSNYYVDFSFLSGESRAWLVRYHATAEPNTKVFMETISRETIGELQHVCVQLMAYKKEKTFQLKQPASVEMRLDLTKFYKLHTFTTCDFFEERVMIYDVVTGDAPVTQVFTNAEDIRNAILSSDKSEETEDLRPRIHAIAVKHMEQENIEVVDLHAAELLDNMRGMNASDILEYQKSVFNKKMEENRKNKGKKIIFIHGKGNGVLRNAIIKELNYKYKNCTSQDASFREYGYGATMVIVH